MTKMEVPMKHKRLIFVTTLVLCYALMAGGCGSGESSDKANSSYMGGAGDAEAGGIGDETESENMDGVSENNSAGETADDPATDGDSSGSEPSGGAELNTDMLVYSCRLAIDTLDYEKSVRTFRDMLTATGGFVENENFTDGQSSSSSYYIEEQDKNRMYTATVRVPHDKYDEFLNGADQLGDVRSRTSDVQNMGQEYTDLGTTLQIYEAKEKRYIEMLATIKDDEHAITVEKELTELQVQIAKLKSRMNEIRTDVAYSTIEIQIHQVAKYEERSTPKRTDTFFQRLGNTVRDTWKHFLVFLEALLFFIIRVSPYLVIIVCIIVIIYRIQKRKTYAKEEPPVFPNISISQAPDEEEDAPEDENVQTENQTEDTDTEQ